MTTIFPTELPDRPGKTPKLGLTKRLTQKWTLKRKKSVINPALDSSDSYASAITAPPAFPGADNVPHDHVFSLQRLAPSPNSVAPNETSPQSKPFPPKALFKSFTGDGSAFSRQASSNAPLPAHGVTVPFQPEILRKQIPLSNSENATKDPLIERFSKLRFSQSKSSPSMPMAPAASTPELSPRNAAPPFTLFRAHTGPAATTQVAWKNMSNPNLSTAAQELQLSLQRQNTNPFRKMSSSTRPEPPPMVTIDDESESDTAGAPTRTSNFSKTNYFQSASRRRPHQGFRNTFNKRRNRRRSRSPSSYSSSSEDEATPASSYVPYPDLTTHAALAIQEEQDRQLAQLLQQEEDEADAVVQSLFREELRFTANQQPSSPPGRSTRSGTRENPINIDSDFDDEDDFGMPTRAWARTQEHDAIYEDLMELDDYSPAPASDLHVQQDAEMARMLQAEFENENRPPTDRDCAVCGDSFPIGDLPALANCTHRPETCTDCYSGWITTQLQESSWREVKCPGDGCKVKLEYYEIQQYATQDVFQQYDTYIARAALSEDPNFRWCRACNSGQIHLSGVEGNIFTCASCNHKCCVIHENTWHEGETCEEYDYRSSGQKERDQKAQEEASKAAVDQLSKKCPGKGCVYSIEKNDGCDHMTCSKCGYEFCWICLCDYNKVRKRGNAAHTEDCKYHSARLR